MWNQRKKADPRNICNIDKDRSLYLFNTEIEREKRYHQQQKEPKKNFWKIRGKEEKVVSR